MRLGMVVIVLSSMGVHYASVCKVQKNISDIITKHASIVHDEQPIENYDDDEGA